MRGDEEAFSDVLKLSNAIYFSIVTMTTGYISQVRMGKISRTYLKIAGACRLPINVG